jgi:hypothetical protein
VSLALLSYVRHLRLVVMIIYWSCLTYYADTILLYAYFLTKNLHCHCSIPCISLDTN